MNGNSIPVSIGILTHNSGATLRRCLESLAGFAEIIIADGGSVDTTMQIAQKYSCKVINQSVQDQPIVDFAKERNLTLQAATQPWFFYLDSDEIMSPELKEKIRQLAQEKDPKYKVYNVAYYLVNKDTLKVYRQYKTYFQTRFFSTKIGAQFIKPVHERIKFDNDVYQLGKINEPWYVPLDVQLNFRVYQDKVQYRLGLLADRYSSTSFLRYIRKAIYEPLLAIIKMLIKIGIVRIKYKKEEVIPFRYELYRMYSHVVLIKKITQKYLQLMSGHHARTK